MSILQLQSRLLVSKPNLRATKQRESDEPAHFQFFSITFEGQQTPVDPSIVWIENFSTRPLIPVLSQTPEDSQPRQRFVLQVAVASGTPRVRIFGIGIDELLNSAI
jgi:hypothetical protein